jgi:hypothetical protein
MLLPIINPCTNLGIIQTHYASLTMFKLIIFAAIKFNSTNDEKSKVSNDNNAKFKLYYNLE